jgi:Ca-activated chloride channel family protein
VIALLPLLVAWGNPLRDKCLRGNRAYEKGRYDEALQSYVDAQLEAPDAPELHFNAGDVNYRQGKFKEAAEEYARAAASPKASNEVKAGSFYNLGNTAFRAGDLASAVSAYEQSLKLKPDDMDAKYNLALARKKLKEEMNRQAQGGGQQQQQQSKGQQGQKKEQGEKDRDKKAGEESEAGGETKRRKPMEEQEAKRILEALEQQDKDNQRRMKYSAGGVKDPWKDW